MMRRYSAGVHMIKHKPVICNKSYIHINLYSHQKLSAPY